MSNELVKLAVDVYKGSVSNFSNEEAEQALRAALIEINGGSDKLDFRSMRRNSTAIFEATEEILAVLLVEGIEQQFSPFTDVRNLEYGDKNFFMVEDYNLFPVATISSGNGNLLRQRLHRTPFSIQTGWKGVKVYEELERFLSGRSDWAYTVNKVNRSFQAQIAADIYGAITTGYNALATPYKYTGSYDRTQFNTLVQHVEAITNRSAIVYGTKLALQQVTAGSAYGNYLPVSNEEANRDGFYRVVDGIQMVEIKQAITPGTDNFAIGDNFLLVIPQGEEKLVKMVIEGQPIIQQTSTQGMLNADDSVEYMFRQKYGVGVVTSTKYGAYILS